jgi:hypothetical protein
VVGFNKCFIRYVANPGVTRCNASICDFSLAGSAGSNPTGGMDVCLL